MQEKTFAQMIGAAPPGPPPHPAVQTVDRLVRQNEAMQNLLGMVLSTITLPKNREALEPLAREWLAYTDEWWKRFNAIRDMQ